ncbi:MAG: flagellar brake protein [Methylobacter sp.]|nr:flagellar brake protein [Methylobacter sp.]
MSDIPSFTIHHQRQITSNLLLLLKNKCLISARFGENNDSYLTTLLGINEENNTIFLDYGPKDYINKQIVNAKKVYFETEYKGIKVTFTGSELKEISYEGDLLFSMSIPKALFWMERREYFRVKIPISKPSYCQFLLKDREPINIKIHDLSLTGFSIMDQCDDFSKQIATGSTFDQCKLILFQAGEHTVSFGVLYSRIINPEKLQKMQKNGCKFISITRSVDDAIQSYMQRIQREDLQDGSITPERILVHKKIIIYLNDR